MNSPIKPYSAKRDSELVEELRLHFTNISMKEELKRSDLTTEIISESLKQILQGYWIPKKKCKAYSFWTFSKFFLNSNVHPSLLKPFRICPKPPLKKPKGKFDHVFNISGFGSFLTDIFYIKKGILFLH